MIFIHTPYLKVAAVALFPFCLIKKKSYKNDYTLINHERIHFEQQKELFFIPFYMAYLIHYLFLLAKYQKHYIAYQNIIFEKEAYSNENNLGYLNKRKTWAFLNY